MSTTPVQIGDMAARLMLARLNISQWSARKLDRSATSKTTNEAGAKADAARVNKFLLSGNDTGLKAIGAIATAARADYYALTAPWTDNGDRVLTADAWKELNSKLSAHSLTYAAAVDDFIRTDYTDARDRAFALALAFDAGFAGAFAFAAQMAAETAARLSLDSGMRQVEVMARKLCCERRSSQKHCSQCNVV